MAANRDDEPGVLGNLPRSRLGQRSDKRGRTATPAKKARATRTAAKKPPTTRTAAKKPAPRERARPRPRPQAQPKRSAPDPIGQAVQVAGKVAAVGVGTVAGL